MQYSFCEDSFLFNKKQTPESDSGVVFLMLAYFVFPKETLNYFHLKLVDLSL